MSSPELGILVSLPVLDLFKLLSPARWRYRRFSRLGEYAHKREFHNDPGERYFLNWNNTGIMFI